MWQIKIFYSILLTTALSWIMFWRTTIVIKVKMITVTYSTGSCIRRTRCVVITDAQTKMYVRSRTYFCLSTAQYIHIVEYSECFITDARMFWRSLWGSVVFMHIWAPDTPKSLFWQRYEPPSDRWVQNGLIFHLYFGAFSDSEWTRIVVYMQSFGISLWYGLVWQVDLCLYVKITV